MVQRTKGVVFDQRPAQSDRLCRRQSRFLFLSPSFLLGVIDTKRNSQQPYGQDVLSNGSGTAILVEN